MPQPIPSYCPKCDNYNRNDPSVDQTGEFKTFSCLVIGSIPKALIRYCPPCAKYGNVSPAMKEGMSLWEYMHCNEGGIYADRLDVKCRVEDHQDAQRKLENIVNEENSKYGRKKKSHWWNWKRPK